MVSTLEFQSSKLELEKYYRKLMKLNIGCGEHKKLDWVNIDKYPIDSDILYGDLEERIELPDHVADEILLDNVIEHVQSVPAAMKEIHRLLKKGGVVRIYTPHYTSHSSWRDPTHIHHLSFFSFDMFCKKRNGHYLGGALFEVVTKKLSFGGGLSILGRMIFKVSPELYERKFAFWFPASTLFVCLRSI